MGIHDGHRQRLKNRFLKEGLENFQEHEILELILFYCIPQGDTNPLAHDLINRFGSLRGVLNATPMALLEMKGVGEHSMLLLKLMIAVSEKIAYKGESSPQLTSSKLAAEYIVPKLENSHEEEFHIYCLDMSYRPIYHELMYKGSMDALPVHTSRIIRTVLRQDTARLIIAHTHPNGEPSPSQNDIALTEHLIKQLNVVGIRLSDHIIVSPGAYFSFAAGGMVSMADNNATTVAAQYIRVSNSDKKAKNSSN